MAEVYLQSRLDFLRRVQNPDGGWGYFPGKQSWMEPTSYAILALIGTPGSSDLIARAWRLAQSWQLSNGSWRPGQEVQDGTWVTALGVIVGCCFKSGSQTSATTGAEEKSVAWMVEASGAESHWTVRLASYFHMLKTDVNVNHRGWPWRPGNSSWIEPTALSVLALKKYLALKSSARVQARVREGEELILSRRGHDGGWNAGNPSVLNYDVPSYPETTALALIGLQGWKRADLGGPLSTARTYLRDCRSSLAKTWLTIALRCYGEDVPRQEGSPTPDILLSALQCLAHPAGNYRLLQPGGVA